MRITYIRWSMTVIEMNDLIIVTDPAFRMLGRLQLRPLEYTIERLPKPDLILISHDHPDHWDPWTMCQLPKDTRLIVRPAGIAEKAKRLDYTSVKELGEWEKAQMGDVTITAVPAVHPGGEVGFVLEGEKRVYFAGDTALDVGTFYLIGRDFDLDVVLLPIGGLRLGRRSKAIDPKRALTALKLLQPKVVIGTHYGGWPIFPRLVDGPVKSLGRLFIQMRGTPHELAHRVAKAGLKVSVCGMAPLDTVQV